MNNTVLEEKIKEWQTQLDKLKSYINPMSYDNSFWEGQINRIEEFIEDLEQLREEQKPDESDSAILRHENLRGEEQPEAKTLKTTFRFYNDNDAPYFGAYKIGSLTNGEPTLMFCMDAVLSVIKDDTDKGETFRDIALSTITHEFCHAMQEWLGKEFDELEVEKILGAYNEKWNVFNAEPEDEDAGMQFKVSELLEAMDNMDKTVDGRTDEFCAGYFDLKNQIHELFAPLVLWHEAEKKNKSQEPNPEELNK